MAKKKKQQNPNSLKNLEKGKWKKGQSGNPKGRPKKILTELKEIIGTDEDIEPTLDMSDYANISRWLLELTPKELKKVITHPNSKNAVVMIGRALQKDMSKGALWAFDNIYDKFIKDDEVQDGTTVNFNVGFELGANTPEVIAEEKEDNE